MKCVRVYGSCFIFGTPFCHDFWFLNPILCTLKCHKPRRPHIKSRYILVGGFNPSETCENLIIPNIWKNKMCQPTNQYNRMDKPIFSLEARHCNPLFFTNRDVGHGLEKNHTGLFNRNWMTTKTGWNHRKTMGKWWFNGISWWFKEINHDVPSGKLTFCNGRSPCY